MNHYVAPSKIHGKGTFADKDFAIGENIGFVTRVSDTKEPGKTYFTSELSNSLKTFMERTKLERYLNHSITPNAKCIANGTIITLLAIKPIKKDEEITANYSDAFKTIDEAQIIYRQKHRTK